VLGGPREGKKEKPGVVANRRGEKKSRVFFKATEKTCVGGTEKKATGDLNKRLDMG